MEDVRSQGKAAHSRGERRQLTNATPEQLQRIRAEMGQPVQETEPSVALEARILPIFFFFFPSSFHPVPCPLVLV